MITYFKLNSSFDQYDYEASLTRSNPILNRQIGFVSFCNNHSKILGSRCKTHELTLLRSPCYSHLQSFTGSIIVVIRAASAADAAAAQPQAPATFWAIFENLIWKYTQCQFIWTEQCEFFNIGLFLIFPIFYKPILSGACFWCTCFNEKNKPKLSITLNICSIFWLLELKLNFWLNTSNT